MSTTTRSGTRKLPRKRYTVDAFEGIQDLVYASSDSGSSSDDDDDDDDDDQDRLRQYKGRRKSENHDPDTYEAAEKLSDPDNDYISGAEDDPEDDAGDTRERDLDGGIITIEDSPPTKREQTKKPKNRSKPPDCEQTTAGPPDIDRILNLSRTDRRALLFGPLEEDWTSIWSRAPCVPTRNERDGRGGFHHDKAYQQRIANSAAHWSWYEQQNGKERFISNQSLGNLSENYVSDLLIAHDGQRNFVAGAVGHQKMFCLQPRQYIPLSAPWKRTGVDVQYDPQIEISYKSGFMINMGARIACLDWAPRNGPKQYLAVALTPATASSQGPSSSRILIWEFQANDAGYMDKSVPPKLRIVLCTFEGAMQALLWCPLTNTASQRLGLIAFLSKDGIVRIVDLPFLTDNQETINLGLREASFTVRPPGTVCTSFAWVNPSCIVAGCANGFIAAWDLSTYLAVGKDSARPVVYAGISNSPIISIASCAPSFSNLLAASNSAGQLSLTDLTQPDMGSPAGTVLAQCVSTDGPSVVWHDAMRAVFSVDDGSNLRAYPVPTWENTVNLGQLKNRTTCMAVSPCHPSVLIGTTNGDVIATNPIKRLYDGGNTPVFQLKWFAHEWRMPTSDERKAVSSKFHPMDESQPGVSIQKGTPNAKAAIAKSGLSRFVSGFKASEANLENTSRPVTANSALRVIHEDKIAIACVAWNPNIHVAGWAAAGMADGLLRVEDIAI